MDKTLVLNGIDFSSYVQWQVDRLEKVRKVYGPNNLTDIDGNEYPDLIAVKIDPGFLLKPLPKFMLQTLFQVMSLPSCSIIYTSFEGNETRKTTVLPQDFQLNYAVNAWNGDVYQGTAITFKEK